MEILFYRYKSICEPDVIESFRKLGIDVVEERIADEGGKNADLYLVDRIEGLIKSHKFLFVFSINFFPVLSDICNIMSIPYISWTVDVPVMELFSPAIKNSCNRIFMFDRMQYSYFKKYNPSCIFYLPLATNPGRWEKVIAKNLPQKDNRFSADISFVGSLYNEKNAFRKIKGMSEYTRGYIQGIVESQLQVYGVNFVESVVTEELLKELSTMVPDMHQPLCEGNREAQKYLIAHAFIGSELAQVERTCLLNLLAKAHDVELYTLSDTSDLSRVHVHGGADSQSEMPMVFASSRINLNITMRPIATGLSLRVYDICGCGGFLMTNWQEELPELYEPGTEAEFFVSGEELLEKVDYYLRHDDEREKIAIRGLERTKAEHTYDMRIAEMIRVVGGTL